MAIEPKKADIKADPDTAQVDADDPTAPGISSWTFEKIADHLAEDNGYSLVDAPVEFWVSVGMKAAQLHYAGEAAEPLGPLSEEASRTTADLPEANKEDDKETAPF